MEAKVKTQAELNDLEIVSEIALDDGRPGTRKRTRITGAAGAARSYEFTCSRCHLIKPKSHLSKAESTLCVDCT
jgi:hypothetical protein